MIPMNTVSSYLDCLKESFLNVAAKAGRLDEVSSLLALGTEVDYRQSNQDDTALLASIRSDQKDAATLLLAYGADSSLQDREGNNVIHLAAATGNVGFLDLFPTSTNLFKAKNWQGNTPEDVAIHQGNSLFAKSLKRLIDEAAQGQSQTDVADDDAQSVKTEESADTVTQEEAPDDDLEDSLAPPHGTREKFQELTELVHSQAKDLYQVKYTLTEVAKERDRLQNELCKHQIDESDLRMKTLSELNTLEEKTRKDLDRITQAREMAVNKLDDERVCCICRVNPKTCVLLTCRHMCVCSEVSHWDLDASNCKLYIHAYPHSTLRICATTISIKQPFLQCGSRDELTHCPLCRNIITKRINVFA